MKALSTPEGKVVLFRPKDYARRFRQSAARLVMPPYPIEEFVRAVQEVVKANRRWVPPYNPEREPWEQNSLYIRPVMIGSGPVLGVKPARTYTFYIFVSPVGPYLPGEGKVMVIDSTHRTALYSTGNVKAAGNYAGTLLPHKIAQSRGYKDVLYLDARHDRYVEELGSSNFFVILQDGTLVTPPLDGSILPGITRDSVMTIARELLGWKVIERYLDIEEVLTQAREAFFTGTAAVIQPISEIYYRGRNYRIGDGDSEGSHKLRELLVKIQTQQHPDPFGWVQEVT
jgi:branched-chain amino acid aminotransferase